MTDKLDIYDLLSVLIPGALLAAAIPVLFPKLLILQAPHYPDAYAVVVLTGIAFLVGHIVQALASLAEPLFFWTWGGRPSDLALQGRLGRYFGRTETDRVKAKLAAAVGTASDDAGLFRYAMHLSDATGRGRSPRFNVLYAYHRSLTVFVALLLALFVCSSRWGAAHALSVWYSLSTGSLLLFLLLLLWFRTKQRAMYYAREVLLSAERLLDDQARTG